MKLMRDLYEHEVLEVASECYEADGSLDVLKFAAALFLKATIRFGQPSIQPPPDPKFKK